MKLNHKTRRAFVLSSIGLTSLALFAVTVMSTVQAPAEDNQPAPWKSAKFRRMLTDDAELALLRKCYAEKIITMATYAYSAHTKNRNPKSPEERKARNDELWGKVPNSNEPTDFGWLMGDNNNRGFLVESADLYEKTLDKEVAWDAAVALCAFSEKYPSRARMLQSKFYATQWGAYYLAETYDRIFDFIKDNQKLADYVGGKIPGIKSPQDLTRFLDRNLLQACQPYDISGVVPVVLGVCPESDQMLEKGVFRSFRGCIPHKVDFSGPIEDVSYISPYRVDLWQVEPILRRYRLAGGSLRYDLETLHPGYSTRNEIGYWEQVHISGGFRCGMTAFGHESRMDFMPRWPNRGPSKVGGHMSMFTTITQSSPSRVMENVHGTHVAMDGYSMSILESGQFQDDLLKMRGAWVQYNQQGLPLQATAHGGLTLTHYNRQSHQEIGLVAPGAGGGVPGRVANIVVVDSLRTLPRVNFSGKNFLTGEGIKFPMGMNTGFAPLSGAQFMEHTQTPFANVSLYVRQNVLVDVGDAESYIFDVVRVRGGKMHAYCLNAIPGKFESNAKMSPVSTMNNPDLDVCLQGYIDAVQNEGNNPAVIQADWIMDPELQKHQQNQMVAITSPADQIKRFTVHNFHVNQYQSDRPVTTRVSMLGHEKDRLMVGRWSTVKPERDYWNLYVQGKQETEGKESVYPAIIETFAGKPFLAEKRLASLSPEQKGAEGAVGVEVKTVDGRTDLLYSGVKPQEMVTVDGKIKMSGKFAFVSRDAKGLRKMSIVGGTELSSEDFLLKPDRTSYETEIVGAADDKYSFTVKDVLPEKLLKKDTVSVEVKGRHHKFKLTDLKTEGGKTTARYERTAKIFQSNLAGVEEKEGLVSSEIPPLTVRVGMTVTNEKQDKFWRVTEIVENPSRMKLDGSVKKDDFTDANGDGKIKVSVCLFGPGDRMKMDGHVDVERNEKGVYTVESNVECTIGLPKEGYSDVEISADGKSFSPIPSQTVGSKLTLKLSQKDLVDGKVILKLK